MMARFEITNLPGEIDFECGSDFVKRTVQNAKNLLMCRMGEVPFDRLRGLDARLYELPMPEMNERLLQEIDRALLWEPDVEAVSAKAANTDGAVVITCVIEVRENA